MTRLPCRLLGYYDSALRAREEESSGLALRGLAVLSMNDKSGGKQHSSTDNASIGVPRADDAHLVEFIVRRTRRVVIPKCAAELNALLDVVETLILISSMHYEVLYGTQEDAISLMIILEDGKMLPPIDVEIDARSVHGAISAHDTANPQYAS